MIKKIILNIIYLSLIVLLLDLAIGRTLRYYFFKQTSGLDYRTTFSIDSTHADLLIFGASRANHHYVPNIFEDSLSMSYYNTGRDGNGIYYQLAVLKSVLKRHTPKIIILDFIGTFEYREKDFDRLSSLLPYYEKHDEIRNIVNLRSPFEKFKLLSQIYPFNSNIFTIAIGNTDYNKKRKPNNKGYISLDKVWSKKIDSIKYSKSKLLDTVKLKAFQSFIRMAKESNIEIYVVYSPIFQLSNENYQINKCDSICTSEEINFWDYSKDTLFLNNPKLFQDTKHLNHNGAKYFSKLVVEKIKNH